MPRKRTLPYPPRKNHRWNHTNYGRRCLDCKVKHLQDRPKGQPDIYQAKQPSGDVLSTTIRLDCIRK